MVGIQQREREEVNSSTVVITFGRIRKALKILIRELTSSRKD
jgi:hypothetical protein